MSTQDRSRVIVPIPFDPADYLAVGWSFVPDEHDKRNEGLVSVDLREVDFVHSLRDGETSIDSKEKMRRLKAGEVILYGAALFRALLEDYETYGEEGVLENLFQTESITYIDFPGDVVLDANGEPGVLCLCRDLRGHWKWDSFPLGDPCERHHLSAVSRKIPKPK